MNDFISKSDVLEEKMARAKKVRAEIKRLRSVGDYDEAEFLLNELRNLNRIIKNFRK